MVSLSGVLAPFALIWLWISHWSWLIIFKLLIKFGFWISTFHFQTLDWYSHQENTVLPVLWSFIFQLCNSCLYASELRFTNLICEIVTKVEVYSIHFHVSILSSFCLFQICYSLRFMCMVCYLASSCFSQMILSPFGKGGSL